MLHTPSGSMSVLIGQANQVQMLTCGLATLYSSIHRNATTPHNPHSPFSLFASNESRTQFPSGYWSTPQGALNLSNLASLPLLARRFKPLSVIGEGTFAQILSAQDTFDPLKRSYAIKVLNRNFGALGLREESCLTAIHASQPVRRS